jgi:FMN phosphatase YigB (HAD superfamily)
MPKSILIITDLDNTMYNWVDFFSPSFRGMLHALNERTGVSEELLQTQFRSLFQIHGSLEYEPASHEIEAFSAYNEEELKKLNRVIFGAFRKVWGAKLKLYDGALTFLDWCNDHSVNVIALTNAPLSVVSRRLRQLRINHYFSALAAPNTLIQRSSMEILSFNDEQPSLFNEKDTKQNHVTDYLHTALLHHRQIYALSGEEIKPSSSGYKRILADWQDSNTLVYAIGDSLKKDLAPAYSLGIKTVWAKFGTEIEQKNLNTLLNITPWNLEEIKITYDQQFEPDATAQNWDDIIKYIERDAFS